MIPYYNTKFNWIVVFCKEDQKTAVRALIHVPINGNIPEFNATFRWTGSENHDNKTICRPCLSQCGLHVFSQNDSNLEILVLMENGVWLSHKTIFMIKNPDQLKFPLLVFSWNIGKLNHYRMNNMENISEIWLRILFLAIFGET